MPQLQPQAPAVTNVGTGTATAAAGPLKVAVVGGSLGGLAAANVFHRLAKYPCLSSSFSHEPSDSS